MPSTTLSTALLETQELLNDVERRFEELAEERNKLQAIVHSLEAYLGDSVDDADTDIFSTSATTRPTQPAWMSAREVLLTTTHPLTVPEIHAILTRNGISIGKDALRIAMIRKSAIFHNFGDGLYGLAGWLQTPHIDSKEPADSSDHYTLQELKEAHPSVHTDW